VTSKHGPNRNSLINGRDSVGTAVLVGEGIFLLLLCIQLEIYVVYEGTLLAEVGVSSY
jgi:hypothetical protein